LQPEDPNVHKTREQDFRKGRQTPNSGVRRSRVCSLVGCAGQSRALACLALPSCGVLSAPPMPFPAPHLLDPDRTYPAGVYIYYTSAAVSEIRLPIDGRYLILCRGAMGVGRDQVNMFHGSALKASTNAWQRRVSGLLWCDVPRACAFYFGSLRSTCRARHQSGTTTPVEAGPAWKQNLISRKTTCFVSSLARLDNFKAVVAGGRLWHIEKLKFRDGMPRCRDQRLVR
jgi:hypothetical protein